MVEQRDKLVCGLAFCIQEKARITKAPAAELPSSSKKKKKEVN